VVTEAIRYSITVDGGGTLRVRVCLTGEMLELFSLWRLLAKVNLK